MKPSTKNQVEGAIHDVKGRVKEAVGAVANKPDLKAEGEAEQLAGAVQKKVGQVEKVFNS